MMQIMMNKVIICLGQSKANPGYKPGFSIELPMRKKSDLASKICCACTRPFVWRKKWAKVWDAVKYCSERCRRSGAEKP
jgi:hypothetical protein